MRWFGERPPRKPTKLEGEGAVCCLEHIACWFLYSLVESYAEEKDQNVLKYAKGGRVNA